MNPPPIRPLSVTVNIGLVGHGYQVDYYLDGVEIGSECRDFADDHKVVDLQEAFLAAMVKAIETTRRTL